MMEQIKASRYAKFMALYRKSIIVRILTNLFAIFLAGIFLMWIGMIWLDDWTEHGKELEVPSVKGLSYNDALQVLADANLGIELSDSIYDNATKPGTVLDQNPRAETKVKSGRTIFVTVNAFSPKSVTLPLLQDVSVRQARSILEGLGLVNIVERRIPSEFKDLVQGLKYNGQLVTSECKVPISAQIELLVGEGETSEMPEDTNLDDNIEVLTESDAF